MWVSRFGRNFDQTSAPTRVEVWSKFARHINEIHCKFDKTSTKMRHQTSTKLRPNFDTHIVQNIYFLI